MKQFIIITLLIVSILFLIFVIFKNAKQEKTMMEKIPPIETVKQYDIDGLLRTGLANCLILGTGSMQPYIKGGKPTEVVAAVKYDKQSNFKLLQVGQLIIFEIDGKLIVHQLVELDNDGWITAGSHNERYDSGRVTEQNFKGVVEKIFNIED